MIVPDAALPQVPDIVETSVGLEEELEFSDFIPLVNTGNLDNLERELYDNMDAFDRIDEIESCSQDLLHHRRKSKQVLKSNTGIKVLYDCKTCEKVFMTLNELNQHELEHEIDYVCDICEKTFRKESYLNLHRDIHVCRNCGISSKLKNCLCSKCEQFSSSPSRKRKAVNSESLKLKRQAMSNLHLFLKKSRSLRN